jgi:hypothetical protein
MNPRRTDSEMKTFRSRRKKLNKTEASELAKRTIGRFGYVKFDETNPMKVATWFAKSSPLGTCANMAGAMAGGTLLTTQEYFSMTEQFNLFEAERPVTQE